MVSSSVRKETTSCNMKVNVMPGTWGGGACHEKEQQSGTCVSARYRPYSASSRQPQRCNMSCLCCPKTERQQISRQVVLVGKSSLHSKPWLPALPHAPRSLGLLGAGEQTLQPARTIPQAILPCRITCFPHDALGELGNMMNDDVEVTDHPTYFQRQRR